MPPDDLFVDCAEVGVAFHVTGLEDERADEPPPEELPADAPLLLPDALLFDVLDDELLLLCELPELLPENVVCLLTADAPELPDELPDVLLCDEPPLLFFSISSSKTVFFLFWVDIIASDAAMIYTPFKLQ